MELLKDKIITSILTNGWNETLELFYNEVRNSSELQTMSDYIFTRFESSDSLWYESPLIFSCGMFAVKDYTLTSLFILSFSVYLMTIINSGYLPIEVLINLNIDETAEETNFGIDDYFSITHLINNSDMFVGERDFMAIVMSY